MCTFVPAIIGLLYPFFDHKLGEPHKYKREWSSVMRCIAVFVGINHASAVSLLRDNIKLSPFFIVSKHFGGFAK